MESNTRSMEKEVLQFLHDVRAVLRCHQTGSVTGYPAASELSSFLAISEQKTPPHVPIKPSSHSSIVVKDVGEEPENSVSDQAVLAEIKTEVAQCRSCELANQRKCTVCGSGGGADVRLMLIGHWLPESEASGAAGCQAVFGTQEDAMLSRMLTAIHVAPEEVLITNVIKCSVGPGTQPQAAHIDACASYLQRQIKAASPKLICTMGMVATRAVLQLSHPLSRLRGRFHSYTSLDGQKIPVLPTFHPGYLLQNPEMKKATWEDLQVLEKRIVL